MAGGTRLALTEYAINVPWGVANVLVATELNLHTRLAWRWCYYMGLIFAVISLVGTLVFYFPPARPSYDYDKTRWQEVKELDFVGLALYTGGLVILLIGLSWAAPGHLRREVDPSLAFFCQSASLGCRSSIRRLRRFHTPLPWETDTILSFEPHLQRPRKRWTSSAVDVSGFIIAGPVPVPELRKTSG